MEINLSPFFAKLLLWLTHLLRLADFRLFNRILVMCKGYSEDYENFTELVWTDDKYLDFYDRETYPQFQLWI